MTEYQSASKRITVKGIFTCTDGREFDNSHEAELHQADLGFIEWYKEGVELKHDPSLEGEWVTVVAKEMVRWLRNHQSEVSRFFGKNDLSNPYKDRDTE